MKTNGIKITAAIFLVLSLLISGLVLFPVKTKAQYPYPYYDVKLYSNSGQIIGEWKSTTAGQVDGNSFTFRIEHDGGYLGVRICGNYTVEELPRQ